MMNTITTYRGRTGSLLKLALAVVIALPLTGCEGILDVTDPDIVTPENLESEVGLQTVRNGALGEFTLAYSGGSQNDGIITMTGLLTDEWMHSGTFTTRFRVETRNIELDNGNMTNLFRNLHQARTSLENAAGIFEGAASGPDERIGEMYYYAGMLYVAFAENYCSGVPFSTQPESGETEFGGPESRDQMLDRAVARFNSALGAPGTSSDIATAARVGIGRAELNRGNLAAAVAGVAGVADDFVLWSYHSDNSVSQRNSVYEYNKNGGRWSLGDTEGINGLDFRTSADPRITSAVCAGCAFDKSEQVPGTPALTDNWWMTNYQSRNDPVRLATGIEAALIRAEADMVANPGSWLAQLNGLRAQWASLAEILAGDASGTLAPLGDPGTAVGREDLMFRERAFWLFSTGHRMGDLRRLVRQYGRGAESVFPTGTYWKPGANYLTDVNFPVPKDEDNNPMNTGCTDRAA